MPAFAQMLHFALANGQPFALGIISGTRGSSPQKKGAKALFFPDGRIEGTLGGGCLEAEIRDRARRSLLTGQPMTFDLVLDHLFGWDDGLICGGKVEGLILPRAAEAVDIWQRLKEPSEPVIWGVRPDFSIGIVQGHEATDDWPYTEVVAPPAPLWIAGSGHIAQAVARWAIDLDFAPTVFDDRPELANHAHFPNGCTFRVGYWDEILSIDLPKLPTYGLILTRGHQHDALTLRRWIQQPFEFLGMIGSRRKARIIFEEFLQQQLASPDQIARVVCPVGLPIQSRTVPEIALSILAQLVEARAKKSPWTRPAVASP